MSNTALAFTAPRIDPRRERHLRRHTQPRRALRPWSEVTIAGSSLQAAAGHPMHINRSHLTALIAMALILHAAIAWYFHTHTQRTDLSTRQSELNIELVRPPKPIEPPKVEPPKPQPVKSQLRQTQVLPHIEQSEPLPSTVGESNEAPVAVAPIVSQPAPAASEPVTPPIGRAGYLNNPPPEYPPQAVRQGWQGNVLLHVHVLASGNVDAVEIKQSSGKKLLDDEAVRTVKRWQFTPSKRGDVAVDGWATVPIEFLLDQ